MGDFDNIRSRPITRESMEGHERTFGPSTDEIRQPKRTRYVYRGGKLVEMGGPDDPGAPPPEDHARNHVVSDLYMDGVRAPDGTDIGSRRKRWRYMNDREDGRTLTDASDWTGEWDKAAKKREAIADGSYGRTERRDQIGRTMYELSKQRR